MASHDEAGIICQALGHGVTRSKRKETRWMRKAAENGHAQSCLRLAQFMYLDLPYARVFGHVGEAAGAVTSAGLVPGHDVPLYVLISVIHWLREGGHHPIDQHVS